MFILIQCKEMVILIQCLYLKTIAKITRKRITKNPVIKNSNNAKQKG